MFAPDSCNRVDQATDLAIPIIGRGGLSAVTPRSIAEQAEVSRQAVHQWLGGQETLRLRIAERFTARWVHWATRLVHRFGVDALLPDHAEVRRWTRVWAALLEVAGRDLQVAELVAVIRTAERRMLLAAVRDRLPSLVHAVATPLLPLTDSTHVGCCRRRWEPPTRSLSPLA